MAEAITFLVDASSKAKLNIIEAGMIANLRKLGNSYRVKAVPENPDESGGTYNFKRRKHSTAHDYGTARTAGRGDALQVPNIPVEQNIHREIVEELNAFDANRYGYGASLVKWAENCKADHQATLQTDTEEDFWRAALLGAIADGTIAIGFTPSTTESAEAGLENHIVALETTRNDYVRGIPRRVMAAMVTPAAYSKLKSYLNTLHNTAVTAEGEEIQGVNGVAVFSELYLPKGLQGILCAQGCVAQPLTIAEYAMEKIPFSQNFAMEKFYDYGVKAIAGDTIRCLIAPDGTHTKVEKVSALSSSTKATDTFYVVTGTSATVDKSAAPSATNYWAGLIATCDGTNYAAYGGI